MLTNCPSCVQGLGRNRDIGLDPQHLAVALAVKYSGTNWAENSWFRPEGDCGEFLGTVVVLFCFVPLKAGIISIWRADYAYAVTNTMAHTFN